jgi:hypothetical protein
MASSSTKVSQASSRLYDVPSLENDGSNFQTWKYRVMTVLRIRRLWDITEGKETKPDPTKPDELEEWLLKDGEALAQITLTLKDEPLSGVLHVKSAAEAWKKLCERYEGKGKQTIAYLIRELFRGTLSEDSPMETQLNAMRQTAHILSSLGQILDDSLVAIAMIISLPPSYSTLSTILMSTSDKLSIDSVISQVLIEEKSRKASSSQSALFAKGPGQQKAKSESKDKKKQKKCNYCSKLYHVEKDCRKKKADEAAKGGADKEKPKEPKADLSAKVAHTSQDQSPIQLFAAYAQEKGINPSHWIVDSGASANMSCR